MLLRSSEFLWNGPFLKFDIALSLSLRFNWRPEKSRFQNLYPTQTLEKTIILKYIVFILFIMHYIHFKITTCIWKRQHVIDNPRHLPCRHTDCQADRLERRSETYGWCYFYCPPGVSSWWWAELSTWTPCWFPCHRYLQQWSLPGLLNFHCHPQCEQHCGVPPSPHLSSHHNPAQNKTLTKGLFQWKWSNAGRVQSFVLTASFSTSSSSSSLPAAIIADLGYNLSMSSGPVNQVIKTHM